MALKFRYSALFVPSVPETVAFYERAFSFQLRYMHSSSGYAELETGDTLLAFVGEDFIVTANLLGGLRFEANRPAAAAAAAQLAFVTDDMDGDWMRALSAGATVVKAPELKPWGQTAGYLRDCNGAIVELCTRSPRDGPA